MYYNLFEVLSTRYIVSKCEDKFSVGVGHMQNWVQDSRQDNS